MEQITLDFSGDGALDALVDILSSGHWTWQKLNYEADTTALLLRLLQQDGIGLYRMPCAQKAYSEETRRRARHYADILHKRDYGASLLRAAELFGGGDGLDYAMTANGALFFPSKKAYVRTGGVTPEKLLGC